MYNRTPKPNVRSHSSLVLRLGIFGIAFFLTLLTLGMNASLAHAASTYYVSPTGNDTGPGTTIQPFATFAKAFSVMASGDTLILKDGTYYQRIFNPPSGTPAAYTTIKAENDGRAILDGSQGLPYPGAVISIESTQSYIRIEGLKGINGDEKVISLGGNFIELKRVGAGNANTGNTYAEVISVPGNNNLLEDVWAWGAGRYVIDVGGSGNILRRVVIRWDGYQRAAQPVGGLALYDAVNSIVENFIALDFNPPPDPSNAWGAIYGKGAASGNKIYGAIAVNIKNHMAAYWLSEWDNGNIFNSVAWDTSGSGVRFGSSGVGVADHVTISGRNPSVDGYGSRTVSNSVFLNGGSVSASTLANNIYFNTPNAGGAGSATNDPQIKYLPRAGDASLSRGANILTKYLNGADTGQSLWPWPYEDRIKSDMCGYSNRGFCLKPSLTQYIWEYLGNPCPANICSGAKTFYVSPTGSDSNAGTSSAPFATFAKAFSAMTGGDTLIVKDGTYNQRIIDPPSGTASGYTIIKAENDGKATIDGGGVGSSISISGRSYIQLEGLKATNGYDDGIDIDSSQYIKVLRASIYNGPAATNEYGSSMTISRSSYILVEDSYIWGRFRYGFQIYGWTSDGIGNSKIIFRRNVARFDGMQTNQPVAAFMVYGHSDFLNTQDILFQNNIVLDFNPPPGANIQAAFSSDKIWQNIKHEGNIALNLGSNWQAFAGSGYGGSNGKYYENNAVYGTGTAFRAAGNSFIVNQATIMSSTAGFEAYYNGDYKNTLFVNNGANINGNGIYNDFYNSGTVPSGTGNRVNNPNLLYLTRTTDTGTGDGGAKRGATIEKMYGISGTLWGDPGYDQLTSNALWPFPNEAKIRTDMCASTTRGWCGTAKTLTQYVWEYLGNSCPADICGGSQPPPAPPPSDTTAPSVSISAPASGTMVSGVVTVSATASDPSTSSGQASGVAGVQFKLDGNNLGVEDTASPYSVTLDTTTISNGSHTLSAVARDAAGNTTTSASVAISVSNIAADNTPPTISSVSASLITTSGATISWTTNEASDSRVEYGLTTSYGSLTPINTSLVTSHSISLSGLSANTLYNYRVTAKDAASNLAISQNFIFTTTVSVSTNCAATNILCVDDTPGSTREYATIQAAADGARPGDTVLVYDGNYAGFQVTTSGTVSAPITFKAASSNAFISSDGPTGDGIRLQNVNYITIDGFTIQNSSQRCIAARGATPTAPMFGNILRNNSCSNSVLEGFYVSEFGNSLIENNTIVNAGRGVLSGSSNGIYLANAGSDNTTIRGNTITGSGQAGIHFNGDLSVGGDGIISGLTVEKNIITGSGQNALNMDGVSDSLIQNNLIYGNARHALRAYQIDAAAGPRNLKIVNNTFVVPSNGGWDIKLSEDLGGHVVFNNFLMNDNAGTGSISIANANFVSNNNAVVDRFSRDNESTIISFSSWKGSGNDANSVLTSSSALFSNPSASDYRLKSGAPAIDAGRSSLSGVAAPATDLGEVTRPQGVNFDMGAYEQAGSGLPGVDNVPPSTPANLSAQVVSSTQINLSWTASTDNVGVTGYKIFRNGTQVGTAAATSYQDTGLSAATTYTYTVAAYDAAGNTSAQSSSVNPTTQAPADTTPPTISAIAQTNITTSSATITWTTNEPATSQVEYGLTTSYGSLTSLDTNLVTTHSVFLSGLAAGTTYNFRVRSKDAAGNEALSINQTLTTTPLPDTAPPGEITTLALANSTQTSLDLKWTAVGDDGTTGTATSYEIRRSTTVPGSDATNWWNSATALSGAPTPKAAGSQETYVAIGLSANTTYYFAVRAKDEVGQISALNVSSIKSASTGTPADTTPPTISAVAATSISPAAATITWTTNEVSDSQVEYGLTTSYGSTTTLNTSLVTSHSQTLSSLSANTLYHYRIKSKDAAGNLGVSSDNTFTTLVPPDTTAPVISSVATTGITQNSATITWTTNEVSDSQVEYGLTTSYGSSTTLNPSLVIAHPQTLSSLSANTTYHYRVKSKDAAGNLATSPDGSFTTLVSTTPPDTTPPTLTNIQISGTTATSTLVTWTTNELADSSIKYGVAAANLKQTIQESALSFSHSLTISDLTRKSSYYYQVFSKDAAGNQGQSAVLSFQTLARLPKPPKPGNVQARQGSVILSWDPIDYELTKQIMIFRRTNAFVQSPSESPFLLKATLTDLTATSYTDQDVTYGTKYYYTLFTIDDQGLASDPVMVEFTPVAPTAPPSTPPPSSGGGGGAPTQGSGSSSGGGGGGGGAPTIDTTPPPQVSFVQAGSADSQVALTWKNPTSADYVRTIIVRKVGSRPSSATDGQVIYEGTAEAFVDVNLTNGQTYYYGVFTVDRAANYSKAISLSGIPEAGKTQITVVTPGTGTGHVPTGSLVKYPNDPTVYVIENGEKRPIPSYDLYLKEYKNRPIAVIPETQTYPDGAAVSFGSGSLLKGSAPAVYLVLDNGSKYGFKSAEEFFKFGYRFNLVRQVADASLASYPDAGLVSLAYHATNNFVKYPGSPTVYKMENGKKRGVPSAAVFLSYADFSEVITISPSFQYPDGPLLGLADGSLVKGSAATVYLISDGQKRPFTSAAAFLGLGYNFAQVKVVNDSDLQLHPDGSSI